MPRWLLRALFVAPHRATVPDDRMDTMWSYNAVLVGAAVVNALRAGTPPAGDEKVAPLLSAERYEQAAGDKDFDDAARDYTLAARALGAGPVRIIMRHIAVNTLPPLMIQAALTMAFSIIAEASLSYLGLGASPPVPTIGLTLQASREFMLLGAWWFVIAPVAALALLLVALNFLADAILEATSPYVRSK